MDNTPGSLSPASSPSSDEITHGEDQQFNAGDGVRGPIGAGLCPVCQSQIAAGEATTACPGCAAVHHGDCWQEVGGCGIYGCVHVPPTEKRGDMEIPAGYWGKESKSCPRCTKEIQAMAVRCRHCGAEMSAGSQQTDKAWRAERAERADRAPLRTRCVWVFAVCVIPPLAPLAVIPATVWWLIRRGAIARVGSLHHTLVVVGIILAWLMSIGVTVALIVATAMSNPEI